MSARGVLIVVCAAACRGASVTPAPTAARPVAWAAIAVAVEFDPPLPAAGTLVAVHESGLVVTAAARPSGAELSLPPGPASLRLECFGARHELAIRVTAGMPPVVWAWRPARVTTAR